jgi:3-dehydroquinate dehydratase-1
MVDVELATARGEDSPIPALNENGTEVICSHRDFEETPGQDRLAALIEACSRYGDVAKVATAAGDRGDALRLLTALYETTGQGYRVAGLAMGAEGSLSRVLAPFYGSVLGYAPLASDEEAYAPGQLPIHTLASLVAALEESCG